MKGYHIFLIVFIAIFTAFVITISNRRVSDTKKLIASIGKDQVFIVGEQEKVIQSLNKELQRNQIVTVSFYHPASRGINSDSDCKNTAIMRTPIVGRTAAVSKDLFDIGWFDSKVYIEGFGVFVMEDRMDSTIKGKQIDICVSSKKKALRLGIKPKIKAVKLNIF